ncbi:MAG: sensor histidine kinase [Paenibacillaceae bacterium]|jgi:signal transduction histidine kinase|nr:sensor histidine kinase [Paenibacillaceae bacterium]
MTKQAADTTTQKVTAWLVLQSFIIIAAAVLSFMFVEFAANLDSLGDGGGFQIFSHAIGIIIPMAAVLGALNYYLSKFIYQYVSILAGGIEKVANGDFQTTLDVKKAGPFAPVYENFNKMGAELQNVQALRNDFINNYSHEFKTPITSINGFAELLLETEVTAQDQQRYLRIIAEESARLTHMADSTILLSKLNAQHIIPDQKLYSLDEQLRQCAILLSFEWTRKEIEFVGSFQPVMYHGNAELMSHLWINLLSNAIKFTPEHGEITVTSSESNGKITVQISDTGVGMSEDVISHIFDQYYQGETAHSVRGLGLGLSIAKRIAELCKGTIEVRSVENEGSTFTVTLPG